MTTISQQYAQLDETASALDIDGNALAILAILAAEASAGIDPSDSKFGLKDCEHPKSLILDTDGSPADDGAQYARFGGLAVLGKILRSMSKQVSQLPGFIRRGFKPNPKKGIPEDFINRFNSAADYLSWKAAGQPSLWLTHVWRAPRIVKELPGGIVVTMTKGYNKNPNAVGPGGLPFPPRGWRPQIEKGNDGLIYGLENVSTTPNASKAIIDSIYKKYSTFNFNNSRAVADAIAEAAGNGGNLTTLLIAPFFDYFFSSDLPGLKCGCPDPLSKPEPIPSDIVDILQDSLETVQNLQKYQYLSSVADTQEYQSIIETYLQNLNIGAKVRTISQIEAIKGAINNLVAGAPLSDVKDNISNIIEALKVFTPLGAGLSPEETQSLREMFDLIKSEYESAISDLETDPALNIPRLDPIAVQKLLDKINFVGEKQCPGQLILNDACECVCPSGQILCPDTFDCYDCQNESGGYLKWNGNRFSCECGCVDDNQISIYVLNTHFCVDPCPEGLQWRELSCDDPMVQYSFTGTNNSNSTSETKCYACVCVERKLIGGRLTPTIRDPYDCPENQIKTGTGCECDCMDGFVKHISPSVDPILGYTDELDFRCRPECPQGRVYVWESDSCECGQLTSLHENRTIYIKSVSPGSECADQPSKIWQEDICACVCPSGTIYNVLNDSCDEPPEPPNDGSGSGSGDEGSGSGSGYDF